MHVYELKLRNIPLTGELLTVFHVATRGSKVIQLFSMICSGMNNIYHFRAMDANLTNREIVIKLDDIQLNRSDYTVEMKSFVYPSNKTLYVIAGTYSEYVAWKRANEQELRSTIYVHGHDQLDQWNPDGIFIGSWKERSDIVAILTQLFKASTNTEKREKLFTVRAKLEEYYINQGLELAEFDVYDT